MDIEKIFLYNDLMDVDKVNHILRGHGHVLSIVPAYTRVKMYHAHKKRFPIAVRIDEDQKRNNLRNVTYGALLTIECDEVALKILDGYNGCSKGILLENDINDLFNRELINVVPIEFKSIDHFLNCDYKIFEQEECWIYVGNKSKKAVQSRIQAKHQRAGHVWRTFFTAFLNENLFKEIQEEYSK